MCRDFGARQRILRWAKLYTTLPCGAARSYSVFVTSNSNQAMLHEPVVRTTMVEGLRHASSFRSERIVGRTTHSFLTKVARGPSWQLCIIDRAHETEEKEDSTRRASIHCFCFGFVVTWYGCWYSAPLSMRQPGTQKKNDNGEAANSCS